MKELFSILVKDYQDEGFTRKDWAIAFVAILGLITIMAFAGWMDMQSMQ